MTKDALIDDVFREEGTPTATNTSIRRSISRLRAGGIVLATLRAYFDAHEPGRRATVLNLREMTQGRSPKGRALKDPAVRAPTQHRRDHL